MMSNVNRYKRKGAVWPLLLSCLALVIAGLALAVDSALLWQARQELQVAADASSLGAVLELADDQLLRQQPGKMQFATDLAQKAAMELGYRHHVLGVPLRVEINNPGDLDVMLGFYDPAVPGMQPAFSNLDHPLLNAIEVTTRRTRERGTPVGLFFTRLFRLASADVMASATAVIDRHVVGFRPIGQMNVPMMPLGLLSDPTGVEVASWEAQIDKPLAQGNTGVDLYAYDKVMRRWSEVGQANSQGNTRGDGLPEFTLRLPLGTDTSEANGKVLHWGKHDVSTMLRQVEYGLTALDLQGSQGQIELSWDGLLPVEESTLPGGSQQVTFIELLTKLHANGDIRLFPLFVPNGEGEEQNMASQVMVRGFVAARIASVSKNEGSLELILQPTVMITTTALTRPAAGVNPYVGKVKLIR